MNYNDPNMSLIANEFRGRTFGSDFVIEHGFLYDQVVIAAGSAVNETTSQFFHNVGAGTTKTIAQTNLSQSRRLDPPQQFSVRAIRLVFRSNILRADLEALMYNMVFEFYIADAWKVRAPIACFPAGGGVNAMSATTASSTTIEYLSNGVPTLASRMTLALPLLIESGVSFVGRFAGTAQTMTAGGSGGTGLTVDCILEGLHARPTVA